jgi:putative Holliday junction resolvase
VTSEVKGLRKRLGLEVVTHDERLTTVEAGHALRGQGLSNRRSRQLVDQVAAAVILQSCIDAGPPSGCR